MRAGAPLAALLLGCALLAACGADPGAGAPAPTTPAGSGPQAPAVPPSRTQEYLPGLDADVYEPTSPGGGPLVVLVPGGGWRAADRSGLAPLAAGLAGSGATVVSVTYRTAESGAYFPAPLEDVACAVGFAAARTVPAGGAARPLVVVGHSAGANLAALAALAPGEGATSCPYPGVAPDAFVGLAGPYDVSVLPGVADALFGVPLEEDPDLWADGNPLTHADGRPDVPVLLLHGEVDQLVPVAFSTDFAAALEAGGHAVTVEVVPGADHSSIYRADVAADRIADWIGALP